VFYPYKWFLIAGFFLVPFLVLTVGNSYAPGNIRRRASWALLAGWAWVVASSVIAAELDFQLAATEEQRESAMMGDGARMIASVFFGWAYVLPIVLCYCGTLYVYVALRRRRR
jgi:hypothetical protein